MTGVRVTAGRSASFRCYGHNSRAATRRALTPTSAALRLNSNPEKDSFDRERATQTIASSYWRRGDYESALAQTETLSPRNQGGQLLYFVGLAIKSKQPELARRVLNRALKLVTSGEDDADDAGSIREFARFAAEVDDLELASRFGDELDEGSARKAFTLIGLADAWAKRGEKEKAVSLVEQGLRQADRFDDEERRDVIDLFTLAVKVLVYLSEKDRAAKIANQSRDLLMAELKPSAADRTQVALSFARLGEFPAAMAVEESLDDGDKVDALISLAGVYQARGDEAGAVSSLLEARAILESTSDDDYSRSIDLHQLATAYLRIGKPDEAFDVMRGISHAFYRAKTATELATTFFARNRRQDARAALDFAYSQIRKIVSEESEDIPAYASGSKAQTKSHGLMDLGEKYIEIGDPHGAEAAAMAIDHPQYKASLLARVAAAYAREGDKLKAKSLLAMAFKLSSNSEEYSHDSPRNPRLKLAEAYADAGLKQESANAILRLLRELRDGDHDAAIIECLIEVGLMAETKGVPLNRSIEIALKQLIKKAEDN